MFTFDKTGNVHVDRPISELDTFTHEFITILRTHCPYSLVGGFLAIILGRSRGTEDVDVFIPKLDRPAFEALYRDLKAAGFWCLNAESPREVFAYLKEKVSVRFGKDSRPIPNIEMKFSRDSLDDHALEDTIKVFVRNLEFVFSSPEMNIAFKRFYLKSSKDLEDADHIEGVFKDHLDLKKIETYKALIRRQR